MSSRPAAATGTGASVLITGATGYIGRALTETAAASGWTVYAACRQPPGRPGVRHVPYRLEAPPPEIPEFPPVVIHLAAETGPRRAVPVDAEIGSAARLLDLARSHGSRFVFVSSQAAAHDAPSPYGRVKHAIEQLVLAQGQAVVRPGLVYGGNVPGGLFGRLCGVVARLPILPALVPAPQVQPIHVADLCQGLLRLASQKDARGIFSLGAERDIPFTEFLRQLAAVRVRKTRLFVPIPASLFRLASPLFGLFGFDGSGLASLLALRPMATGESLRALALSLRPLSDGLHPSGSSRRRRLAAEGRLLLGSMGVGRPEPGVVRRYVRAVEAIAGGDPLPLPGWLGAFPAMIPAVSNTAVRDRTAIAFTVFEFTPGGARFCLRRRASRTGSLLALLQVAFLEGANRALATIRRPR